MIRLLLMVLAAHVTVTGIVLDPSGAAVARVPVTLTAGRNRMTATSDASGRFRIEGVAPGRYRLRVNAGAAFNVLSRDVVIHDGMEPLTLKLTLAAVQEQVEVTENAVRPSIDTGANLNATKINASTLDKLPILDNDVIAAMTPFLAPTAIATSGPQIIVDGVEVRNLGITKSDIQEIKINSDPYSAMWDTPGRGRIEIVTKNDTAAFHGAATFSFRNSTLDSANYFATVKPPESRRMFEMSIRGPLLDDRKTSFFLSGSTDRDDSTAIVNALTPDGPLLQNVAAPFTRSRLAMRVSHDFSVRDHWSLQYNWRLDAWRNRGVGGLTLPAAAVNARSREDETTLADQRILSDTSMNQLAIGFERGFTPTVSATSEPGIVVQGAFIGGGAQASMFRTEHNYKISDIVTLARSRHSVTYGIQIPNISHRQWADESNQQGTFSFASLADYIAGRPYAFTIQQGFGRRFFYWKEFGGFVQDQMRIGKRLEVLAGIRYDWQNYFHERGNYSPRMSVAWSPPLERTTVVRAGAGIFYDRSGVAPIADFLLHNGSLVRSYVILNPSYPDPFAGGVSLAGVPVSIVEVAPGFKMPHSLVFSASVEREVTKSATVILGYHGSRQWHRFRSVDVNAPLPPDSTTVPNPAFGRIQQFRSDGRQHSDALELTFKGSVGSLFVAQAQYAYSRTRNDSGGIYWFPTDQYAPPQAEWGPADFDSPHHLNLLATIHAGSWMDIGIAGRYASGLPYSVTAGADLFHTGLGNARPPGVGRNTLRGAPFESVDLRWAHDITFSRTKSGARAVTVAVDAFNVFNHANFLGYVGNIRSPLFEQPTTASAGRLIQLSAEAKF